MWKVNRLIVLMVISKPNYKYYANLCKTNMNTQFLQLNTPIPSVP